MSGDKISIIAAMAHDRVIGYNNELPWKHIPWDFKNFKRLTIGRSVIMGARTFDSIIQALGKPLPDRHTIVVSRMRDLVRAEEYSIARSIADALEIAHQREQGNGEIFIAGGGQIYEQTLPFADRLYLTIISTVVNNADTFFPPFPEEEWCVTNDETITVGSDSPYYLRFKIFERKPHL